MKLSEFKNEDAIDLVADLIEPASLIFSDSAIADAARSGNKVKAIGVALKNHKKSVIEILARLDNTDVESYDKNVIQMTLELIELLNDSDLMSVFGFQGQMKEEMSSGSAMENIEGKED